MNDCDDISMTLSRAVHRILNEAGFNAQRPFTYTDRYNPGDPCDIITVAGSGGLEIGRVRIDHDFEEVNSSHIRVVNSSVNVHIEWSDGDFADKLVKVFRQWSEGRYWEGL